LTSFTHSINCFYNYTFFRLTFKIYIFLQYEKVREHQWSRWQQSIHKKSKKEMKKIDNEKDEEGDVVMGDVVMGEGKSKSDAGAM
jgi:hypothetical protein